MQAVFLREGCLRPVGIVLEQNGMVGVGYVQFHRREERDVRVLFVLTDEEYAPPQAKTSYLEVEAVFGFHQHVLSILRVEFEGPLNVELPDGIYELFAGEAAGVVRDIQVVVVVTHAQVYQHLAGTHIVAVVN